MHQLIIFKKVFEIKTLGVQQVYYWKLTLGTDGV